MLDMVTSQTQTEYTITQNSGKISILFSQNNSHDKIEIKAVYIMVCYIVIFKPNFN